MKEFGKLIKENRYYYFVILLFIIAGSVILIYNTKAEVTIWVNNRYNRFFDLLFFNIDSMGEAFFGVAFIIVAGILKNWRFALKAAICLASVLLVTQFAKHVLFPGVLRPTLYFPENYPDVNLRLLEGVIQLKTESFPSGHTSGAFAISTFLALYEKNKKWNWLLAFAAASVGYARIYLSQHFVTDVFVGMIVGVLVTTLVYYFYPKKWERGEKIS